jgi:hypothetical protein
MENSARDETQTHAIGAFTEQLCHLRIERFIDNPSERVKLAAAVAGRPLYQLELRGPRDFQTAIRIGADAGRIFATISTRHAPSSTGPPSAALSVFEIHPEILGAIAVLAR